MTDTEAETPKYLHVSPNCHVRQEVDNIGWIATADGVVVIDALEQPQLEADVLRLMAQSTADKPVVAVINTHTHYDHVALNKAFEKRFGADIINAKTRSIPDTGMDVGAGPETVRVVPMPGCHTQEDLVIWFAAERVVFIGDIFGWGLIPWDRPLDREKLDHILKTYQRIIDLKPDVVVPGHGPLCTAAELQRWRHYVTGLVEQVRELHGEGMSRRDIPVEKIAPPADMQDWWRFRKWKHEDSVKKVAHAVAKGRL